MDVTSTMKLNEDVANNNGYPDIEADNETIHLTVKDFDPKTSQERKPRNMDAECCQFLNYGRSFCAQALPKSYHRTMLGTHETKRRLTSST